MPISYAEEKKRPKGPLKPYLLIALTVAVLCFCAVMMYR
jgi:hypothetical protein